MFNRNRTSSRARPNLTGWSTLDDLLSVDEPDEPVEPVEPVAAASVPATPPVSATPPSHPSPPSPPPPPMAAEDVATWEQAVDYVEWLVAELMREGNSAAEVIRATARRTAPTLAASQARTHLATEHERAERLADRMRTNAREDLVRDLRSVHQMRSTTGDVATQVNNALAVLRGRHEDLDQVLGSLQRKAQRVEEPDR